MSNLSIEWNSRSSLRIGSQTSCPQNVREKPEFEKNIYSNHLNTGLAWYSDGRFVFGCQMVRYLNGGLKTDRESLFMVQNVWYSNGPPSHVTLTFEYPTPILSGMQMNLVFRWLLYFRRFLKMNFDEIGKNWPDFWSL